MTINCCKWIGEYHFWVENMAEREDGVTAYTVRLSRDGVVETKEFPDGVEEYEEVTAFKFTLSV